MAPATADTETLRYEKQFKTVLGKNMPTSSTALETQ